MEAALRQANKETKHITDYTDGEDGQENNRINHTGIIIFIT